MGSALISTPLSIKKSSRSGSTKDGGEGLGGARRRRAGLRASLSFRRVSDWIFKAALDGVPLAVDSLDVPRPDLLFEEGVRNLDWRFRAGEDKSDQEKVRKQYECEPQPCPSGRHGAPSPRSGRATLFVRPVRGGSVFSRGRVCAVALHGHSLPPLGFRSLCSPRPFLSPQPQG